MCYMGCKYENWHGECRKPGTKKCPVDIEEEEENRLKQMEDDYWDEVFENRRQEERYQKRQIKSY